MNAKAIQIIVIVGLIGTAMVAAFNVPAAYAAVVSNHSGAICKNLIAMDATKVDSAGGDGWTQNLATYDTQVVCPLVRATTNSNGATAYVDIKHPSGNATTTCLLASVNYDGTRLGSVAAPWTGSGFHEFNLTVGSGNSTYWSDYVVFCRIPGNGKGVVMGIDLVEY